MLTVFFSCIEFASFVLCLFRINEHKHERIKTKIKRKLTEFHLPSTFSCYLRWKFYFAFRLSGESSSKQLGIISVLFNGCFSFGMCIKCSIELITLMTSEMCAFAILCIRTLCQRISAVLRDVDKNDKNEAEHKLKPNKRECV